MSRRQIDIESRGDVKFMCLVYGEEALMRTVNDAECIANRGNDVFRLVGATRSGARGMNATSRRQNIKKFLSDQLGPPRVGHDGRDSLERAAPGIYVRVLRNFRS